MIRATVSEAMGWCIFDANDDGAAQLYSAFDMSKLDPIEQRYNLSVIDDWRILEVKDAESALLETKRLANTDRAISLLRLCLILKNRNELDWLYREVEELIVSCAPSEELIREMLVAPFADVEQLRDSAAHALSRGYNVVGNVFNELHGYQPHIKRLSNAWLRLPISIFLSLGASKETLWSEFVKNGLIVKLLNATDNHGVKRLFGAMAFEKTSPQERVGVTALGAAICTELFGNGDSKSVLAAEIFNDDSPSEEDSSDRIQVDSQAEFQRALLEIEGIKNALLRGDDFHANKYLAELAERQIKYGSEFAQKSLCNIAKKCSEMYRLDFELVCLEKSYLIDKNDPWTLLQFADYYKRTRLYNEAEDMAKEALGTPHDLVARCLIADIYSKKGNCAKAIQEYKTIPGWEEIVIVRTAIADNLRWLGRYDEALQEYDLIDHQGFGSYRVQAGRAEIARRQGELQNSLELYKDIIGFNNIDEHSLLVYKTAYASILKQVGEYQDALIMAEDVIEQSPFMIGTRVLRSSLLGLLDEGVIGLELLPGNPENLGNSTYDSWLRDYTRGVLLLKTNKYAEAKESLLRNLSASSINTEEKEILRLASAVSCLMPDIDKPIEAKDLLSQITGPCDAYITYLKLVLDYHVSVIEKDKLESARLLSELNMRRADNLVFLWEAVEALSDNRISEALDIEVESLLRWGAIAA
ncbi:MAG: hypothetical protein KBT88_10235 [Gammaproteobacteria bacterium]|nr:hypothetical protein [Gammaproteobacteria bacterium]MBQ0840152.1 hypothetical protein [Gammaproteobacteria bacterium]